MIVEIRQLYKYIEIESDVSDELLTIAACSNRVCLGQADTLSSARLAWKTLPSCNEITKSVAHYVYAANAAQQPIGQFYG